MNNGQMRKYIAKRNKKLGLPPNLKPSKLVPRKHKLPVKPAGSKAKIMR